MITDRIDNITKISDNHKRIDPPVPESVRIELTGKCNFKCSYCSLTERTKPKGVMDWDLFESITTELKELGVKEIGLFMYGESFTAPELLIKAIKHLKTIGISYVFLTSNGSIATPIVVGRCMEYGLNSLKWSVNYADKKQFTSISGVKGSLYDSTLENIRSAYEIRNKLGYSTKLYASSIHYDNEQHNKMQGLLSERILPYVDQHYWLPLYSKKERVPGEAPQAGNTGRYDNPVAPIPCFSVFNQGNIMSDGRLTACCSDATGEWVVGDLKKQTFKESWYSNEFKELRKAHLNNNIIGTQCENCSNG